MNSTLGAEEGTHCRPGSHRAHAGGFCIAREKDTMRGTSCVNSASVHFRLRPAELKPTPPLLYLEVHALMIFPRAESPSPVPAVLQAASTPLLLHCSLCSVKVIHLSLFPPCPAPTVRPPCCPTRRDAQPCSPALPCRPTSLPRPLQAHLGTAFRRGRVRHADVVVHRAARHDQVLPVDLPQQRQQLLLVQVVPETEERR